MKIISFFVLVLTTMTLASAEARKSDDKVRLTVTGDQLVSRLDKGFHFNKDAPASLKTANGQQESPSKKEESEIVFNTGKVDKKNFTVNFYVCDDAKTVCEEHTKKFVNNREVTSEASMDGVEKNASAVAKPAVTQKATSLETNKNEFIEDNFAAATDVARTAKKLILVDFRAPWCPACIRLETEVFPQAAFIKATASVVKLSINVDRDENKELSKKYAVKAIPTVILMDADGNEIYRSLDYKPAAELSAEIAKIVSNKYVSYESMKLEAEAGDKKSMYNLGLRAYMSLNFAEAVKWLSPLKEDRRLFANAEVSYWAEKLDNDAKVTRNYTDVLEKWISNFPKTYEAITWRNELGEKLAKKDQPLNVGIQNILESNITIIKSIRNSDKEIKKFFFKNYLGDFSNFEKVELNFQLVATYGLLKKDQLKEAAQQSAYLELQKIKLSTKKPGELLMAISYLRQLGKKSDAQAWLEKLVQTYPNTYVYYSKLGRFFYGEKEYAKALPLAQKAVDIDKSIALKNLQFLAEVQKFMNQKQDAVKTVERALALPEAKLAHNKKISESLVDIKKSLD